MRYVKPGKIKGKVSIIGSKSVMQRAVACALLAKGTTTLKSPSLCDDGLASLEIARALGAEIEITRAQVTIKSNGLDTTLKTRELDVHESGLTIRLFSSVVALFPGKFTLHASGTLLKRSMASLIEALSAAGVAISGTNNFPPLSVEGPLKSGEYKINGETGSQVLSGLLTALPVLNRDSKIIGLNLTSKPYLDLTIQVLKEFGVNIQWNQESDIFTIPGNQVFKPRTYTIEGDWSGASFFAVLGALNSLTLKGLNINSAQADKDILSVVKSVGATCNVTTDTIEITKRELRSFEFNATHCPDLFPPLVSLAVMVEGTSIIKGAHRLIGKESNRGEVLVSEFSKLGAKIKLQDDLLIIEGSGSLRGGTASAHGDHRIAMALAVAGIFSDEGVSIEGSESVSKSYPNFFEELESLRQL